MSILYLQTSEQAVKYSPWTVFRCKRVTNWPTIQAIVERQNFPNNLFYLFFASSPNFLIDDEGSRLRCQCPDVTKAINHKQSSRPVHPYTSAVRGCCFVLLAASWARSGDFNETKKKTDKQPKWIIIYCAHPNCPNIFR